MQQHISFSGVSSLVTILFFFIIAAVVIWKYCIEPFLDKALIYLQIDLLRYPDEDCDPVHLFKSILRKSRYWGWDLIEFGIKGRKEELRDLVLKCINLHPQEKAENMRIRITGHHLWKPDDNLTFC